MALIVIPAVRHITPGNALSNVGIHGAVRSIVEELALYSYLLRIHCSSCDDPFAN
jgi:hypothetical protein